MIDSHARPVMTFLAVALAEKFTLILRRLIKAAYSSGVAPALEPLMVWVDKKSWHGILLSLINVSQTPLGEL